MVREAGRRDGQDPEEPVPPDPRRAIGKLRDSTPILMFPVRIETRFTAAGDQLMLRVYPDECLLDTFDPTLTRTEVTNVEAYWAATWEAANDEAAQRAAWASLVRAHGAGRARWLADTHRPNNPDQQPTAPGTGIVPTFDPVSTKEQAWSVPARVRLLPQRFVFIGYAAGAEPLVVMGPPVTADLLAGPDPTALGGDALRHDDDGNLEVPEALRWITDFGAAVDVGMGMRIGLEAPYRGGFDRVLVLGVRLGDDPAKSASLLGDLLGQQARGRRGVAVVPQGTPTNNTEQVSSGHGRGDDADATFDLATAQYAVTAEAGARADGQRLAEALGLPGDFFAHTAGAGSTDQRTARAMNRALFPATIGYWMETMMSPIFGGDTVARTRDFMHDNVLASGPVPAIRIGNQPYGILPTTAVSRMTWFAEHPSIVAGDTGEAAYLRQLYALIRAVRADWSKPAAQVSHVGKDGDPYQLLLDILGLHPGSVEWTQRYAEHVDVLYNRLGMQGYAGLLISFATMFERGQALDLIERLGGGTFGQDGREDAPTLLDLFFSGKHNLLKGGVVDDRPLSETDPVRAYTDDQRNYLTWLADAARAGIDELYQQDGFTGDQPPKALLYLMLRHALQLGYHDVSVRLHLAEGLYTAEQATRAKLDDPFLHIRTNAAISESKYQPLYVTEPLITGSATTTIGQYIAASLATLTHASVLHEQIRAMELLADRPTATLERCFADHVDLASYRLDAWLLGFVNRQLDLMRSGEGASQGVHLGAYAWVENLRPDKGRREPFTLPPGDLADEFSKPTEPPLTRDPDNGGFIHAPSLNHAVAAAVLRNGYLSHHDPAHEDALAVNLTSERVRVALGALEGIRAGQGLSDLLGYQFERGLHDRHGALELDGFIFEMRQRFPLQLGRPASTKPPEGVSLEAIAASNVVDGLALVEQMRQGGETYPFGLGDKLPHATPDEVIALSAEAKRLLDTHDAVSDLALSEGVFQAVTGNYDRVASTYDAYAHGDFPPEPDVVRTPRRGLGLTHRLGLHLEPGLPPPGTPPGSAPPTPRCFGEPAVAQFVADNLPPLASVGCVVDYIRAADGAPASDTVTLAQLGWRPVDVVSVVGDSLDAMAELDERVVERVHAVHAVRPDSPITISYLDAGSAATSVFEALPLVRALRRLVISGRPLTPTDLTPANDATVPDDAAPVVDRTRVEAVADLLDTLHDDLTTFVAGLTPLLDDPVANRAALLTGGETQVDACVGLLRRAALFGLPQTGRGVLHDGQRAAFEGLLKAVGELVERWDGRITEFTAALVEDAALPTDVSDDERFRILSRAERAISATPIDPRPALPDDYRSDLETITLVAFSDRRDDFFALRRTSATTCHALRTEILALLPIDGFDRTPFSLTEAEDLLIDVVRAARDVAVTVATAAGRRLTEAGDHLAAATTAGSARERVDELTQAAKALLGEEFVVVPEFTLKPAQAGAVAAAETASAAGDIFEHLDTLGVDFPVDTWLHGLARVREPAAAWEQLQLFGAAWGLTEPALTAMQLPHVAGEQWWAMEVPEEKRPESDRLLYTAHLPSGFDPTQPMCGLLLDEWSEIIPGEDVDTGLTFHFDRPNTEAPQTMLLVTPTDFRGGWRWDDLVDALNDTLDLAKLRAIEPRHVDSLPYGWLLPATVLASQVSQLTIAADLSLNNRLTIGGS
jgi:hypothetical protein